uniref:Col_cuticle_N domain-containing protein n=1 Tax=Angiostrongylus cantonensis TaxID=6313 RepID=A0A0K0DK93_ANGCA
LSIAVVGATGVTLIHLCSLRCIREQLLEHMDPRTVTRLSEVNHILRSILMSSSVDRTYWMKRLSRYSDHPYATPLPSGTLIRPYDPHPNMPGRTRSPHGPLFPAPDPLQPIPNPMSPLIQPPGVNPFGPGGAPFGGPRGPFGGRSEFFSKSLCLQINRYTHEF